MSVTKLKRRPEPGQLIKVYSLHGNTKYYGKAIEVRVLPDNRQMRLTNIKDLYREKVLVKACPPISESVFDVDYFLTEDKIEVVW